MTWLWILFGIVAVVVAALFVVAWFAIGTVPGRHAGQETFDWDDRARPQFARALPDRIDRLASSYQVPALLLEDLLATDLLIRRADQILLRMDW
jgi:hypothetical protein